MTKQANTTAANTGKGLRASKAAARAPATVVQGALAKLAATVAPAAATKPVPAPAKPVTAAQPGTYYGVPLASLSKSHAALASAKRVPNVPAGRLVLGGKPARLSAPANVAWFAAIAAQAAAGTCTMESAVAVAGMPFVAYCLRRGWLAKQA